MSLEMIVVIILSGIALLALISVAAKNTPRRLNQQYFQNKWMELLQKVKSPEGMILAIIDADNLVDEALRKRNYKGKTMGERLVSAQRILNDNDAVWYGHKLRNRLVHETNTKLKENDAKKALAGFRTALKDLGAL